MRTIPDQSAAIATHLRILRSHAVFGFLALATIGSASAVAVHAQGFGSFSKTKVVLDRKRPPAVYIGSGTVAVEVNSTKSIKPETLRRMKAEIERGLRAWDTFIVVTSNSDTIISCTISDYGSSSRVETRTRRKWQKIGEHTVQHEDTQTSETVSDYGEVEVAVSVTIYDSWMSASYQARNTQTGEIVDSADFNPSFTEECEGAPVAYMNCSGGGDCSTAVVLSIFRRLAPSFETFQPVLPKGKLKDASDLFAAGSWNDALWVLSAMPSLKNPEDDAYRLYLIGVVEESLAYAARDPRETRKLLDQAADSYERAWTKNSREPQFGLALSRADHALREYEEFERRVVAFDARIRQLTSQRPAASTTKEPVDANVTAAGGASGARSAVGAAGGALTNDVVMALIRSGASEAEILTRIKRSRLNQFDLSPPALYRLRQAGASRAVIDEMRTRNSRQPRGRLARWGVVTGVSLYYLLPLLVR